MPKSEFFAVVPATEPGLEAGKYDLVDSEAGLLNPGVSVTVCEAVALYSPTDVEMVVVGGGDPPCDGFVPLL